MKTKITLSTKVIILVLIIVFTNTLSIGGFSYMIHRGDTIKSNSARTMAIAKTAAMSITPGEFWYALDSNQKNENYMHLHKQFEKIKAEEKLLYFYGGTFDPDSGMVMYLEGHGEIFGLNGAVPLSIFPQAAFDAYHSGAACVSDVYRLNIDGSWGISAYAPIFGDGKEVIGLVGVLISLSDALSNSSNFAVTMLVLSLVVFFVIIWVPIIYIRRSVARPLLSMQAASDRIAQGDMDIQVPVRKSADEVGMLLKNFTTMQEIVSGMHQEIIDLVENATNGNLDYRAHPEKYPGEWREVITKFNELMDTIMRPIDEASGTLSSISGGDFSARIQSEYKGDFDLIKKAVNSMAVDLERYMTEKEKAESDLIKAEQYANRAKSDFLSRMSHEMRTPMNAIIGMTKIAESTYDVSKLKYCLDTIGISSGHLLGIINDVLDMSKIEAGKFELENLPMNIEKTLMKVCNLVIDNIEKKKQKFSVELSRDINLNYIADDLRLSQVLTNLLANAVKFTPEGGMISLRVEETARLEETNRVRFSVVDTGIGMTHEQLSRLFNSFEQADGSVSRKYGGTGLGLVISKSIVEKMGGRIWVESEPGVGSTFIFEVSLLRAPHQDAVIFDCIRPEDINLLVAASDDDTRGQFLSIAESFGISAEATASVEETLAYVDVAKNLGREYDIIFLDHDMSGAGSADFIKSLNGRIDKNTAIIGMVSSELHSTGQPEHDGSFARLITKPLFPSLILDTIEEIVGKTLKSLDIKAGKAAEAPDLSDLHIILAEDMDINREIFVALLENTRISIDIAENGLAAVELFSGDPEKYDLIIMDVQMPVMDGFQATKAIREMELPKAKAIPIIAMTANVFKEDIARCIEGGMDDHLAKPIDEKAVIEKIVRYSRKTN